MADLKYSLDLDVKDALKGIQAFKKGLNGVDDAMEEVDKTSKSMGKTFGGLKAAVVGLVGSLGLGALIKASLDSADALGKVANKTGFTITALQELRFAAGQAGIASNVLDTSLQRFSRRVGEAAKGTGVLKKDLTGMGIALKDNNGQMRAIDSIFNDYINGIREASSEQEKLRLAVAAFDMEGANMVNMLGDSEEAFKALKREAHDLGLIINQNVIDKATETNDAWEKVKKQFAAIAMILSAEFAPAMTNIANKLSDFLADEAAVAELAESFRKVADVVITLSDNFGVLVDILKQMAIVFASLKIAKWTGLFSNWQSSVRRLNGSWSKKVGLLKNVTTWVKKLIVPTVALGAKFFALTAIVQGISAVLFDFTGTLATVARGMDFLTKGGFLNSFFQDAADGLSILADSEYSIFDFWGGKVQFDKDNKLVLVGIEQTMADVNKIMDESVIKRTSIDFGKQFGLDGKKKAIEFDYKLVPLEGTFDEQVKMFEEYQKSVEVIADKFNPLKVAEEEFIENQALLKEALAQGLITQDEYKVSLENMTLAFNKLTPEVNEHVKVFEEYQKTIKSVAEEYTPVIQQNKKFVETRKQLNDAFKAGFLNAKEHARAIANLDKEYKDFQKSQLRDSRKWGDGWKRAMDEYVDNATNAAQQAEDVFKTATQGMEDAIVGFAKTGKFEWKSFLDDLVEQLLRAQIQQLIANIFGGASAPSTGSSQTASSAGGFSLGGLGDIVGDVVDGIGDFFGGFFADGGFLPAGQFGIVGEQGPELIGGPANITPMQEGGSTQVTYNINAVDAQSFKQMVAADPTFLFAVTEQGRRSLPNFR